MPISPRASKWGTLPGRLALLFGIGTYAAAGAAAEAAALRQDQPRQLPQAGDADGTGLRVWIDAERMYVANSGAQPAELRLGDTAEARQLLALLKRHGATGPATAIPLDRMLLAGGGGEGIHWVSPQQRSQSQDRIGAGATPATGEASAAGAVPAGRDAPSGSSTAAAPRRT